MHSRMGNDVAGSVYGLHLASFFMALARLLLVQQLQNSFAIRPGEPRVPTVPELFFRF